MIERAVIEALVGNPTEGLNKELKRWIDPTRPAGIEKIIKATIAIRNRNGGFLVIGFDNNTRAPDLEHEPPDAKAIFNIDLIQGIVSKYASDPFEIEIVWGEREGRQYPIVVILSGVRVPVAAKRDLFDGERLLVRNGTVYFRSLAANGTPSTTEAKASDWLDITEICFDNREAEVGRFIRRHLSGIDLSALLLYSGQSQPAITTICDKAYKLIEKGEARYQEVVESRKFGPEQEQLLGRGFWSIGLVIDPPRSSELPTREFLSKIGSSNPEYTGWPIWQDTRYLSDIEGHPYVVKGAFEYLVVSTGFSDHVDFARLDPNGEFFLHRFLPDEVAPHQVRPGEVIDPTLAILRVAEAMGVGIAFAKALGWAPDQTTLCFAFQWHNLKGRRLMNWANANTFRHVRGVAHDPTVENCVQFSLDTPLSALAQFVDEATKPLFTVFDGATMPVAAIDDLVKRLFERRLNFG
jgi:hypothetical protein